MLDHSVTISERIDQMAVRVYRTNAIGGLVEQILDLNPGLARETRLNDFQLTVGRIVVLPELTTASETEVIRLWT